MKDNLINIIYYIRLLYEVISVNSKLNDFIAIPAKFTIIPFFFLVGTIEFYELKEIYRLLQIEHFRLKQIH